MTLDQSPRQGSAGSLHALWPAGPSHDPQGLTFCSLCWWRTLASSSAWRLCCFHKWACSTAGSLQPSSRATDFFSLSHVATSEESCRKVCSCRSSSSWRRRVPARSTSASFLPEGGCHGPSGPLPGPGAAPGLCAHALPMATATALLLDQDARSLGFPLKWRDLLLPLFTKFSSPVLHSVTVFEDRVLKN